MTVTANLNTRRYAPGVAVAKTIRVPVYRTTHIYAETLIVANSTGFAVQGSAGTGQTALGMSIENVDNSLGGDGDLFVSVERGSFEWTNSTGDAVVQADFGKSVYIEDANIVCHTATSKSVAGVFLGFDPATGLPIVETV